MKVYYLTLEGVNSTVFESQVMGLFKRFDRLKNIDNELIIVQKIPFRAPLKIVSLIFKQRVKIYFTRKRIDYKQIADKIVKKVPKNRKVIFHCRNIEAAYIGFLIKQERSNVKVLYDVRGYVEEEKEFMKEYKRKELFHKMNKKLFSSDIYFSFVSFELFELYSKQYSFLDYERKIICNSGYDDFAYKYEKELKSNKNKVKILYIGGNQSYQKLDSILSVFKMRKDWELTLITKKPVKEKPKLDNVSYYNNLSSKKINKIANGFDYGILYRDSKLFNKVATPTKVSEYFGKGLKVIAINSAGAYSKLILQNSFLGYLVKSEQELLKLNLEKVTSIEKEKIANFARNHLSLSNNVPKYVEFYEKIISEI